MPEPIFFLRCRGDGAKGSKSARARLSAGLRWDFEAEMLGQDAAVVETNGAVASGIAINEEPRCVGAFAGGSRAFEGDIDDVRIELL